MKTKMKATILFSMLLILSIACSKDDDDTPTINATNFSTIIDENPADNTSLGTVSAAGTGTLSYSISSQTPNGAISINATTGELTVANASLFDFETNTSIDAVITILNTEAITTVNATINLNNIDDIASFLSTSKTAYTNTIEGNWVEITETEYNNLANSLNEISKAGTTDAEYYTTTVSSISIDTGYTLANTTTTATIPNGGYVFAFKYKVKNIENSIAGFKAKQSSTANNDGFLDIGTALPNHSTSISDSDVFFVLKGNNTSVSATGYLAVYNTAGMSLIDDTNNVGYYYISGDAQTLSGIGTSYRILYQSLNTTQKQWD